MSEKCPVCQTSGAENGHASCETGRWSCPRCGEFYTIGHDTLRGMPGDDVQKRATLSHWIRREHEAIAKAPVDENGDAKCIRLTMQLVESIIKNSRPSLAEQADNYVRWIGDTVKVGGQYAEVKELAVQAIVGSATAEEFELVSSHLKDSAQLIIHRSDKGVWRKVTLSFPGWERYRELKRTTSDSRKAFMAMQFNEPLLKDIVDNVFTPAVKQTGFDLSVLPPRAGLIDDTLSVGIRTSRFLIADLTHDNNGAYWEAGFAEGLGKPVIYTCEKTKFEKCRTHFDTNHRWTVRWDSERREETANELKTAIRATLPAEAKLTND